MVSLKRLFASLLIAAAACGPTPPPPAASEVQEEAAEGWTAEMRTVLAGDAARTLARQCSRISPGPVEDVWTPTDSEIVTLEDQLLPLVAREMEAAGESAAPGDYYRQYAGFVVGGRRIIYVNGVDKSAIEVEPNPNHPFDWRTQAVLICDGGPITFGVEYDPATRQFSNFAFNGSV